MGSISMAIEKRRGVHRVPQPSAKPSEALRRIRADFEEMPDLSVTPEQGARFWHMEPAVCRQALGQLAHEGFVVLQGEKYSRR